MLDHQIHPAKLYADVATALVAIDLFWRHALASGLIALFPPVLVSAVLRRFTPPWVQTMRLFGVGVAFYASWRHVPAGIYGGLALVALCWANGLFRGGERRVHDVYEKGAIGVWRA